MANLTDEALTKKGVGKGGARAFSRLAAVREFLQDQAQDLIDEYRNLAREAVAQGKPDVAEKVLWNLIDSMPKEDGVGLVDSPSSKPPKELTSGPTTPSIQIGVILGGHHQQQQLPPHQEVIDVTPRKGEYEEINPSPPRTETEPVPIMEQPTQNNKVV
jgi:hypothetical protein